ncbi:MAG: hypothetical protein ACTHKV_03755 [Flavipsychrobacter sp.]
MADIQITASDVITEFGSHYIDEGQNMSSLLMRPFEAFGTREAFTNVPTDETQLRYSDVEVGEILQPYQDTYTPKGSVEFKPITIDLQQVKIDLQFNPNKLVYSWLGFLTSNNTDRTTWPFTRWVIEVYLLKRVFEDLEKKVIYTGDKAAVVSGTAGAAIDSMDGVAKIITDGITAGDITATAMGPVPADPADFCTYVEEMVASIDELYWDKNIVFNMSRQLAKRYREGRRQKYLMNYAQISDLNAVQDFENFSVAGRASMKNASRIWGTPIENAVFPTKGFSNATAFELEKVDRTVKIYTDFHIGLGFLLKDLVFTNDQD